jgi:hypothetical protein
VELCGLCESAAKAEPPTCGIVSPEGPQQKHVGSAATRPLRVRNQLPMHAGLDKVVSMLQLIHFGEPLYVFIISAGNPGAAEVNLLPDFS